MRENGRNVIPWFQTSFVVALTSTISLFSLIDIIFSFFIKGVFISEVSFLIFYLAIGFGVFFLIKKYLFDSGRNITLSEIYLIKYSVNQRTLFKFITISICCLLPLLLGFLIWLNAK